MIMHSKTVSQHFCGTGPNQVFMDIIFTSAISLLFLHMNLQLMTVKRCDSLDAVFFIAFTHRGCSKNNVSMDFSAFCSLA